MNRFRTILITVLAVVLVLSLSGFAVAQSGIIQIAEGVEVHERGGAAGGPALYLANGDLLNVRNVQGGVVNGNPGDLNLDLGAGSTENPGHIVLNWDVGRSTLIYDGQKNLVAAFRPQGITFYRPVRFMRGARVVRTARGARVKAGRLP